MKKFAFLTALTLAAGVANAATIASSDSIAVTTTNWNQNVTLNQFDPSLGTLTQIVFTYNGEVTANIRVESEDAAPATVTATSSAFFLFGGPINANLNIAQGQSIDLTAFDGTVDFGGTSGHTFAPINASDNGVFILNAGFAPFIGLGTFDISVQAIGTSGATGAGNLTTQIATVAGAGVTVTYHYDTGTSVPEPATLALLGLGLAGLGFARRRRQD